MMKWKAENKKIVILAQFIVQLEKQLENGNGTIGKIKVVVY